MYTFGIEDQGVGVGEGVVQIKQMDQTQVLQLSIVFYRSL
jgi:hypothetical protein